MSNDKRVLLENELAAIFNQTPNGIEILIGLLSSVTTESQLQTLVDSLKQI
jgi:hypothetical protein